MIKLGSILAARAPLFAASPLSRPISSTFKNGLRKNSAFAPRRLFSDSPSTTKTNPESFAPSSSLSTSQTESLLAVENNADKLLAKSGLDNLVRHGSGDAVITLNVGGSEFCTLRSTVASNEVLAEHVARAEANQEFTRGGCAVFIDRDPTYFPLILNHLRNTVSGLSYYSSTKHKKCTKYRVQLPKDINKLRDIYVEATHYKMEELQKASCEQNFLVTMVSAVGGGGGNPFDQAGQLFRQLRRLATFGSIGGIGAVTFGTQQVDFHKVMSTAFPALIKEDKTNDNDSAESPPQPAQPAAA